jgi:hypothetical protein
MKIENLIYEESDIITTDKYLKFCLENNICYIKTDYFYTGIFNWRGEIHPKTVDDICVVGHSDYPITSDIAKKFKKIFCINKDNKEDNCFGIPLGITNNSNESALHPIYGNTNIMFNIFIDNSLNKTELSYLNINTSTNQFERNLVFEKFSKKSWVKVGNIDCSIEGRKKYLTDIKTSKFVFCPRGNGIDTHRLWETLYMGSIPIVKYENAHHLFTDLPILFIKDWNEIEKKYLEQKYTEMIKKEWNFKKLKVNYWTNFIKKICKDKLTEEVL